MAYLTENAATIGAHVAIQGHTKTHSWHTLRGALPRTPARNADACIRSARRFPLAFVVRANAPPLLSAASEHGHGHGHGHGNSSKTSTIPYHTIPYHTDNICRCTTSSLCNQCVMQRVCGKSCMCDATPRLAAISTYYGHGHNSLNWPRNYEWIVPCDYNGWAKCSRCEKPRKCTQRQFSRTNYASVKNIGTVYGVDSQEHIVHHFPTAILTLT